MHHVRYLVNPVEPGALEVVRIIEAAGLPFSTLPTSGLTTLVVDGFSAYGSDAARQVANFLVSGRADRTPGAVVVGR